MLSTLLIFLLFTSLQMYGVEPEPAEIRLVFNQQEELRGAGVLTYAPAEYLLYREQQARARVLLEHEQERLAWFRDYQPVGAAYREVLDRGRELDRQIHQARQQEMVEVIERQQDLTVRLALIRELADLLKDRRLALPGLVRLEIGLENARRFAGSDRRQEALAALNEVEKELATAIAGVQPVLARYADRATIDRWRGLLAQGLKESRQKGRSLLVVSKAERQLTWYRGGREERVYDAGLGFRFLSAKLSSGDLATPEGVYRVVRKLPNSEFFRALLIDYPNGDDRRRYDLARRQGLIPAGVPIGGQIEIHGGGREGMTEGCVALDNREMAELYGQIELDTPVIIIGTTDYANPIATALTRLR